MINLYANYRNSQSCLKERAFYSPLGGLLMIGLLSENHHKINIIVGEDLLLNEGVVPLFVDHFLHHLVQQINPQLAIVIGQSWCSLKSILASFLHCYYEWPKWCYIIVNDAYD